MNKVYGKLIYLSAIIFAIIVSYALTSRYFPVEPDASSSPLIWRAFLTEGISVFKDWKPTPDNWYFTVYPINFILFNLFSDDGKLPLIISTSLFVALTSIVIALVINSANKSKISLLAILFLTLLPAYSYTYGFVAHPFSHNSTNFFGVLIFGLCFWNINRNSLSLAILYSLIALLSSASDPWFMASYFLPLLIIQVYLSLKKYLHKNISIVFGLTFILAAAQVIPRLLGLPLQHFKLVPFEQWIKNSEWVINILGKNMNFFFVDNQAAYFVSFIVWSVIVIYSLLICLNQGKKAKFISVFCILTIFGMISSFIISCVIPDYASARFFINVICFSITITILGYSYNKNHLITAILLVFICSSLYSYHVDKSPLSGQEKQTLSYIDFLKKNNLSFGYGEYWNESNTVNWLSKGSIHISPIEFNEATYRIQFDRVRPQTFRSWLTDVYVKNSPSRQFISIPAIANQDPGSAMNLMLSAIKQQFGTPDEILTFRDMTFYIYNRQIELQKNQLTTR